MLSNKIHRGAPSPKLIQVFSYSHRYRRTLSNIVTALINRCISIQIGDALPPQNNLLRVAGKNWQFFFEERGISLQEIHSNEELEATGFDTALQTEVEEKESALPDTSRTYPQRLITLPVRAFYNFSLKIILMVPLMSIF